MNFVSEVKVFAKFDSDQKSSFSSRSDEEDRDLQTQVSSTIRIGNCENNSIYSQKYLRSLNKIDLGEYNYLNDTIIACR